VSFQGVDNSHDARCFLQERKWGEKIFLDQVIEHGATLNNQDKFFIVGVDQTVILADLLKQLGQINVQVLNLLFLSRLFALDQPHKHLETRSLDWEISI